MLNSFVGIQKITKKTSTLSNVKQIREAQILANIAQEVMLKSLQ